MNKTLKIIQKITMSLVLIGFVAHPSQAFAKTTKKSGWGGALFNLVATLGAAAAGASAAYRFGEPASAQHLADLRAKKEALQDATGMKLKEKIHAIRSVDHDIAAAEKQVADETPARQKKIVIGCGLAAGTIAFIAQSMRNRSTPLSYGDKCVFFDSSRKHLVSRLFNSASFACAAAGGAYAMTYIVPDIMKNGIEQGTLMSAGVIGSLAAIVGSIVVTKVVAKLCASSGTRDNLLNILKSWKEIAKTYSFKNSVVTALAIKINNGQALTKEEFDEAYNQLLQLGFSSDMSGLVKKSVTA